jgi:hypothetical protein
MSLICYHSLYKIMYFIQDVYYSQCSFWCFSIRYLSHNLWCRSGTVSGGKFFEWTGQRRKVLGVNRTLGEGGSFQHCQKVICVYPWLSGQCSFLHPCLKFRLFLNICQKVVCFPTFPPICVHDVKLVDRPKHQCNEYVKINHIAFTGN